MSAPTCVADRDRVNSALNAGLHQRDAEEVHVENAGNRPREVLEAGVVVTGPLGGVRACFERSQQAADLSNARTPDPAKVDRVSTKERFL